MKKLSKDQIQKIFLGGMLGIGGLYYYCYEMLAPLSLRETAATSEIADLSEKIKNAEAQITRTSKIKTGDVHQESASKAYEVMNAKIPNGSPAAWLPTKLTEFFKRQEIKKQNYRPLPEPLEREFPGFKTSLWVVELPSVEFLPLGKALAVLENQEALMQITSLQIDTTAKEADVHHAQLTISTLVKSEK